MKVTILQDHFLQRLEKQINTLVLPNSTPETTRVTLTPIYDPKNELILYTAVIETHGFLTDNEYNERYGDKSTS